MRIHDPNHELDTLIDAHLDQTIDPVSQGRLNRLIEEDPAASARLIERCRLSYQIIQVLRNEQSREAIDPLDLESLRQIEPDTVALRRIEAPTQPVITEEKKQREQTPEDLDPDVDFGFAGISVHLSRGAQAGVPIRRLFAYAAMLAVAGAAMILFLRTPEASNVGQPELADSSSALAGEEPPYPVLAAQLIGMVDAVWAGAPPSRHGLESQSTFHLASGFVELEFDRGARVVIEGPCQFEIIDDNTMWIDHGTLVANVPEQAKLFSVKTPSADVIDYGTEFCVDVHADGDTEVAVFNGLVELHECATDSSQVTHQIALTAGQMSRIDSELGLDSNIKVFHPESKRTYVRKLEDAGSPQIAYARLLRELKPVAYWPMIGKNPLMGESLEDGSFALTPVGEGELKRSAGPEVFGENQAVAIDGSDIFFMFSPFESNLWEDNEYSISIWVQLDQKSDQNIVAFVPSLQDRGGHYSNQIRIDAQGMLQHYTYCPQDLNPQLDKYETVSAQSKRPLPTGRWIHLAVTYGDDRSRLYMNGRLVAQERAKLNFENEYPTVLVGGATGYHRNDKAGDFKGAACQFAVFNRALTLKEVKALSRPDLLQTN